MSRLLTFILILITGIITIVLAAMILAFSLGWSAFSYTWGALTGGRLWNNASSFSVFEESYSLRDDLRIDLESASLDITVTDDDLLTVRYYGRSDDQIHVAESGSAILVTLRNARRFPFNNWNSRNRVEIDLPRHFAGDLTGKTVSGAIRLNNHITAQSLTLSTVSGSITVNGAAVQTYALDTTSGSVRADAITGKGQISTVSGSVTAALANPVSGCSVSCVSGAIRLSVPSDASFTFSADSLSGSVSSDFSEITGGSHSKQGTVGAAPSGHIEASTASGSIRLMRE